MPDRTEIITSGTILTAADQNASQLNSISGANSVPILGANSNPIRDGNRLRMSYELAAQQIVEHGRGLNDVKASLKNIRVDGQRLITSDGEYQLDVDGLRKLASHFRAPPDYLDRLTPRLRDELLNYHLQTAPSSQANRIYHRNGVFVDLGRSDLHTLQSAEVLEAVREGFGDDALSFDAYKPDIVKESFSLDLVTPRITIEVRRGDEIQAGVRVEHSYIGDRATTVYGFIVRLVCTNGMVHRQCVGSRRKSRTSRTRRLNADRKDAGTFQFDQIKRLAGEVRKELDPNLEAIKKLADKRADESELKKFLDQARMNSRSVVQQLRGTWEQEGNERTAFGLFNALTRLATYGSTLSVRQRGALARLAGIYANSSNHICPHCFSVVNGLPPA